MEVLQNDDKLREEILNDARTKAERLIKKAEKEAEEAVNSIDKQIQEIKADYKKNILDPAEDSINLLFASVDIEAQKEILNISGNILNEIYSEFKESIANNDSFKYSEIIKALIIKSAEQIASKEYIIEANKNILNVIKKEDLTSIKLSNGKIIKVSETDTTDSIMLYTSDQKITSYISIDAFIEELKNETRTDIYNILIKGQ